MSISSETQRGELSAPSAILEHMRRRIARVGLLVATVSTIMASLVIFLLYACFRWR